MPSFIMIAVDIAAIIVLTLPLYYRRHRRRDLVTAFTVVNIGVLSVSIVLANAEVGMGVGLGLFGVLSIIRLRSSEVAQHEVAYYFAALAIGLISGLNSVEPFLASGLIVLILCAVALSDARGVLARTESQRIRLDRAYTDDASVRAELVRLVDGAVLGFTVEEVDLVNDTTLVDVRWRPMAGERRAEPAQPVAS